MSAKRRVAITGVGLVTPVGNDVASTWAALLVGRSGAGRIGSFDAVGGCAFMSAGTACDDSHALTAPMSSGVSLRLISLMQSGAAAFRRPNRHAPNCAFR